MADEEESGGKTKLILVGLLIVVLSGGLIWFVNVMLATPIEPPKKTVQEIKIIRPPPPPPEIEEEPPPPPEEEEVDIPEPEEDIPDLPDMEPPPGNQLGLDAEGTAGGDAFGLAARKGGRGLIGSGDGDANLWFANTVVKSAILDLLTDVDGITITRYRIRLNVWVSSSGEVTKLKLLESTGNNEIDQKIRVALSELKRFSTLPPPNMPQPIKLAIEAR